MALPISLISPSSIASISIPSSSSAGTPGAFQSMLNNAIGSVQQAENSANASVDGFLSGENQEVHQIAIQTQQTEIAFDMFMAVRNKVVSAYQEVMKMQM